MFRNELLLQSKKMNDRSNANVKNAYCQFCLNKFPSCSVCFKSISVLNSMYEYKNKQKFQNSSQQMKDLNHGVDMWLLWCQTCQHGGHAAHLKEWFSTQSECPLAQCKCRCFSFA